MLSYHGLIVLWKLELFHQKTKSLMSDEDVKQTVLIGLGRQRRIKEIR